ncbi:GNAT family N-acetyltransferase [Shimia sp. SDUM112013]|uniref:GNAT family N-acetyltransferase n=1 Tax=Shimia sp. SDUM112013 TaxID=3136160 RepID=UPI0032EDE347
MIRKAEDKDIPAIVAFLERHIATSMFLLGNLEAHGLENRTHPCGTAFFLRETGDGITGVFGASNGGLLMCQLPGIGHTEAQTYAHLLKGYTLRGMTGAADQVATILGALSVPPEAWKSNTVQPLYALSLESLSDSDAVIRAPEEADRAMLQDWFTAYSEDNPIAASTTPEALAEAAITGGRVRLLFDDGAPVAMTAINARSDSAVQVGGVFVPRDLRGQGLAGRVVTAHLTELREAGITRAILFAATPDAARAYEKIGFARAGDYRVALLAEAHMLGDPA